MQPQPTLRFSRDRDRYRYNYGPPNKQIDADALARGPLPHLYEQIALLNQKRKYRPAAESEWRQQVLDLLDALEALRKLDPEAMQLQLYSASETYGLSKAERKRLKRLEREVAEFFRLARELRSPRI